MSHATHSGIGSPPAALVAAFAERYGQPPTGWVRSPYRVCPLGAHVDHQLGLVTALALDAGLNLLFRPRADAWLRLASLDHPGTVELPVRSPAPASPPAHEPGWGLYVRGALQVLAGRLQHGLDGYVQGELPSGGLGSSAALGTALLSALAVVNGLTLAPEELVALAHRIEREVVGLHNGVLDQAANVLARRDHLLYLDCQSGTHRLIPAPAGMPPFRVAVVHSGLTRALIQTGYNQRVAECQEAARQLLLAAGLPLPSRRPPCLRDVPAAAFQQYQYQLPEPLRRRARHFFSECQRVEEGVAAWTRGDLPTLGRLMRESGASSIADYQCGSPELISLYEILCACPGVYGARFSGAGYRGACVALVDPRAEEQVRAAVAADYPRRHPAYARTYQVRFCQSADGVSVTGWS